MSYTNANREKIVKTSKGRAFDKYTECKSKSFKRTRGNKNRHWE